MTNETLTELDIQAAEILMDTLERGGMTVSAALICKLLIMAKMMQKYKFALGNRLADAARLASPN